MSESGCLWVKEVDEWMHWWYTTSSAHGLHSSSYTLGGNINFSTATPHQTSHHTSAPYLPFLPLLPWRADAGEEYLLVGAVLPPHHQGVTVHHLHNLASELFVFVCQLRERENVNAMSKNLSLNSSLPTNSGSKRLKVS